ncbi:MAG: 1-deoxy-D-xylulose 5-phosphate reductoisomerase [Candidatus Xenolissoclinum pacificiensis L6]|uniref:1-deoxy-D-xylulose 5-phosphate reductoisomerase n=1 Tax=Candidatus Xenolissoclinum pacificiensis L6 TaxID=1401685 RepID=W2V0L3_9RICK|nr:MAG: 1-deoxy-D-xylulose 5-phosphate reductoisomerase [Candidatus Xenolissoclinum pacificiensis L6]
MVKRVVLLGSTGSIGVQVLELIQVRQDIRVVALVGHNNINLLVDQARKFCPEYVLSTNDSNYSLLSKMVSGQDMVKVLHGKTGLDNICSLNADIFFVAISGIYALGSVVTLLQNDKTIGLVNKESIVCGGHIICQIKTGRIIPLDSEHYSLQQILSDDVTDVTITASGGSFFSRNKEYTIENALKHPKWLMGKKITVDSATMANKLLEVIEASCLFGMSKRDIHVVIHPECIVHAIASCRGGLNKSVMFHPDMKMVLSYALDYPEDNKFNSQPLNLAQIRSLNFYDVDYTKYPMMTLVHSNQHITINVANEVAVEYFLRGLIKFQEIFYFVEKICMQSEYKEKDLQTVESIFDYADHVRRVTINDIEKYRIT